MTAKEEAILEVKGEIKALKKEVKASKDPKVAKLVVCVCVCVCVCECVRERERERACKCTPVENWSPRRRG